jgi:predicted Zn finger-like uncharacterized protein
MIIECPECSSRFKVPDSRLKPGGIKVRCSRCKHVFRTGEKSPAPPPPSRPAAPVSRPSSPNSGGGKASLGRLEIKRARVNAPAAASPLAGGAVEKNDGLFDRDDPFASTQFGEASEPEVRENPAPAEEHNDSFSSLLQRNEADGFDVDAFAVDDPFEDADPFSRDDPFASTQFASDDEQIGGHERSGLAPLPELDPISPPRQAPSPVRSAQRPPQAPPAADDGMLVNPERANMFQMPDEDSALPGLGGSVGTTGSHDSGRDADRGGRATTPGPRKRVVAAQPEAPFRPTGPVPRMTGSTGGMVLPAAPQATASDSGPLQMVANLLLIVLVLTTMFLGFIGLANGGILDFKELPTQIKAAFGQGTYTPGVAGARTPDTPEATPDAGKEDQGLKVVNVRHTYFPNKDGQQLFLVEGGVLNQMGDSVREIKVQGKVMDGDGKVVASLTAPAGRTLSEEELLDVTAADSLDGAYAQVSKEVKTMMVGPSKATNFTLVFMNLPPGAADSRSFEVEVAGFVEK